MPRLVLRIASTVIALQVVAVLGIPAAAQEDTLRDYVVHTRTDADADAAARELDVAPTVVFRAAIAGFAAPLSRRQVAGLRSRSGVLAVEEDRRVSPLEPPTVGLVAPRVPLVAGVQVEPPNWGLDRIDQRALPLSGTYVTQADGAGVTIYVLDTGVDVGHAQFGGRAAEAVNAVDDTGGDCEGHGTVVAGIAASADYGVAKQAQVRSVKVLDCTGAGTLSALLAGLDWVAAHAQRPSVAVMSWSFGPSEVLSAAVATLVGSGVFVTSSAGNTGADDCAAVPRSLPEVLVVANSTIDDRRAPTSSTGACVDLYAPGTHIISTVPGGVASYSGTSMAAPHAAGVAALYLQNDGAAAPATVHRWIVEHATPEVIEGGGTGGTPDRLLNTAGL